MIQPRLLKREKKENNGFSNHYLFARIIQEGRVKDAESIIEAFEKTSPDKLPGTVRRAKLAAPIRSYTDITPAD